MLFNKLRLFVFIINVNVCICFCFFGDRKRYEGLNYSDGISVIDIVDNVIVLGKVFKYVWQVFECIGFIEDDDDCVVWVYYFDLVFVRDFYIGFVGFFVVCRKVYIFIY